MGEVDSRIQQAAFLQAGAWSNCIMILVHCDMLSMRLTFDVKILS